MKIYKSYMVDFKLNGESKWTVVEAISENEAAFLVENGMIPAKGVDGTYELISVIEC